MSGTNEQLWPVSVKGVIIWGERVVVLKNERHEWELPGGRADAEDASPQETLRREIREELNLEAEIGPIIDSWIFDVVNKRVLMLVYLAYANEPETLTHSHEHVDVAALTLDELTKDSIPAGYLASITNAIGYITNRR